MAAHHINIINKHKPNDYEERALTALPVSAPLRRKNECGQQPRSLPAHEARNETTSTARRTGREASPSTADRIAVLSWVRSWWRAPNAQYGAHENYRDSAMGCWIVLRVYRAA